MIGNLAIPAPSYIPEIKGAEDIESLLKYSHILPVGNPVIVPSNRWAVDINTPLFKKGSLGNGISPITNFIEGHPIIFYDPPEFFRYTLSSGLITYALKGSRSKAKKFYSELKKGNINSALELTHPFFHPFIEEQLITICKDKKIPITFEINSKKKYSVSSAWEDPRIDNTYASYIIDVIKDAIKMPMSTVIPPVPPLMRSTSNKIVGTVLQINKTVSVICQMLLQDKSLLDATGPNNFLPYFHLYLDWSIVDSSESYNLNSDKIVSILNEGLNSGQFSGVAITLNGYENAAKTGKITKIESLMNEIVNISHEHYLPVILPRSDLFGLFLTDMDIQGFSSLLNGNPRYSKPSGAVGKEDKFGKTYLVERCVELKYKEVCDHLKMYNEFPLSIEGLPNKPSSLTNDKEYRINWSKPMRLSHIEEARRIRKANENGVLNPARLYLKRSDNLLLNNL